MDEINNKSYDNLSRLGEESEEFSHLSLAESSVIIVNNFLNNFNVFLE